LYEFNIKNDQILKNIYFFTNIPKRQSKL